MRVNAQVESAAFMCAYQISLLLLSVPTCVMYVMCTLPAASSAVDVGLFHMKSTSTGCVWNVKVLA
jgi:hypothetical protein